MLRVGLTGGIGAGKSTVAARLDTLGAIVVDADRLARGVLSPGSPAVAEVRAAFGDGVFDASGVIDRAALAKVVFADPSARQRLEEITHPRIAAATAERFAEDRRDSATIGVHDVPLLVEKHMEVRYHLVIVVHAEVEERIRRLVSDRRMTVSDVRARIAAQADDGARRAAADIWLDNTRGSADLLELVDQAWRHRLTPFAMNLAMARPAEGAGQAPDDAARARLLGRLQYVLSSLPQARVEEVPSEGGEDGASAPARFEVTVAEDDVDAAAAAIRAAGYAASGDRDGATVHLTCDPGWPGTEVRLRVTAG